MNDHQQHPSGPVMAVTREAGTALFGLRKEPLYWLLAAMPVAVVLRACDGGPLWIFVISAVAIIPLAGLMGRATEALAETLGAGIGGLLNATFGNAAELMIAMIALSKGPEMYPLVKASITGSIIGNILLVLGLAILLGGLKYDRQTFNRTAAGMGATLLALACVGLVMPTVFYGFLSTGGLSAEELTDINWLSEEIAAVLILIYVLSLVFSLKTHRHLFSGTEAELREEIAATLAKGPAKTPAEPEHHAVGWSRPTAVVLLLVATAGVAWMSELLVSSVEHAGTAMGLNHAFIGVIVVAVIGNAAEHSTAVLMAMKNKMDLAFHIAVGSGIQIALFVAPVLVFASMAFCPDQPLDLHFTALEMITMILAVGILALVSLDGQSHWMEGVMLLGVYVIFALAFFHLPLEPTELPVH